jgi:hypothetical protein
MPRQSYPHHVRHYVRTLADAPELVWERVAFEERYGSRGFRFEEGQSNREAWLDIYATQDARLRMQRRGLDFE